MREQGLVGIEDYLDYSKHIRKQSEHTINAYKRDLDAASQWFADQELNDFTIGHRDLRAYLAFCTNRGLSPRTINRRFSALRSYSRYWVRVRGRAKAGLDAAVGLIRSIRTKKRLPEFLFPKEMETLLSENPAAESRGTQPPWMQSRDNALWEIMYSTGCRVSETAAMTLGSFNSGTSRMKVLGKGQKQRFVFLGQPARAALEEYLVYRRAFLRRMRVDHDYLWVNNHGNPLSVRGIQYLLEKRLQGMNVQKHLSPHGIRHSFATHILNNGADIRVVQELLGHKNLSTTQVYTHLNLNRLRDTYNQAHPHGQRRERKDHGKT
ncbi:tyrosine-type recombinase/integrase [Spirochaeta lutea]|uniref:Tyrosine recombinase XerC n=1 Tax=Spirochaeta lutea TaxID=1480694 RepID=A0A098R440_9SPIO|nr:tyrosine-type recombinase/integrase [Spirochaeta lutea]KGE73517.1 hypothetical protein DC28_02295 [Spirochaeta lutea]